MHQNYSSEVNGLSKILGTALSNKVPKNRNQMFEMILLKEVLGFVIRRYLDGESK